ncbi:MAG: TrmH family RNA methyltransferase [Desulfovibrionaceae bacterium]
MDVKNTPQADVVLTGRKPVAERVREDPEQVEHVFLQRGLHGSGFDSIVDACRKAGVRFSFVPKERLDALFPGNHQGVAARIFAQGYVELETMWALVRNAPLPVAVALDQVQDPGNAGTLARTLYALGGGGIIVPRHNAAHLGAAAERASSGTLSRTPVARVANLSHALEAAADEGFAVYGAAADGLNAFTSTLRLPAVLVLGNEEKGVRPGVAKRCEAMLSIPQARPLDSINVAQAGAILLARFAWSLL